MNAHASYLLADPRADADGTTVRSLSARYVLSTHERAEYAHLPRTAVRHRIEVDGTHRSWMNVRTLCGQSINDPMVTDDPGGAECGTCLGRELGITEPDIRFAPRLLHRLPPKWCDGSRRGLAAEVPGSRRMVCLLCGQGVRWWGDGLQRHEHYGVGTACPAHGTDRLAQAYELTYYGPGPGVFGEGGHIAKPLPYLTCTAHRCELSPRRFWLVSPHGRKP